MVNIGIVQMNAAPLKVNENLIKADALISQAVKDGAELVVLPEMFNVGLFVQEQLMKLGEPLDGLTTYWLKDQAAKNKVFIITSIYEQYEGDFYNTMVMVGYDGSLQIYRKRNPTVQERLVWKRCDEPGPGIFDTPFGRIGGAICFDSFFKETYEGFKQSGVEFVIIVALWGTFLPDIKYPDTFYFNKLLKYQSYLASEVVPQKYAKTLEVPVVYVNQSGTINIPMTHPRFYPMLDWKKSTYDFVGNSNIYEPSGKKLVQGLDLKAEFCTVVPVGINQSKKRPEVSRVNIPSGYMKKKYYFVEPPFMFKLYQKLCFSGFKPKYEEMCGRHA
ncbi:carbon-nitrogen hydrolase family protein [Desulfobacula toluolica]|uniref:Putative nitrilase n=1 Tax=Desulfobacula toluolica (strain DSM 7467 / Tol2) TaxID=651182 RepID=K0N2J9_DESTT|nr:carbon-nitrogen hydrolase family protein [Desulfobacula toluolica]CCK78369.1 putative nitrilase [Desulfobacula toluolica Tol2]